MLRAWRIPMDRDRSIPRFLRCVRRRGPHPFPSACVVQGPHEGDHRSPTATTGCPALRPFHRLHKKKCWKTRNAGGRALRYIAPHLGAGS